MVWPDGVVVDSKDSVYVLDTGNGPSGNNRVEVFTPFHDVATTGLTVSRNSAYSGVSALPVTVNVTVSNFGLSTETVWVIALANTTLIGNQTISLGAGQSRIASFSWSPNLLPRGTYRLTSSVQVVSGDPNPQNNSLQAGLFYVRLRGDVNGDCRVDVADLASVGSMFGASPTSAQWNPNADLNNDRTVNIIDLVLVAGMFGQSC